MWLKMLKIWQAVSLRQDKIDEKWLRLFLVRELAALYSEDDSFLSGNYLAIKGSLKFDDFLTFSCLK